MLNRHRQSCDDCLKGNCEDYQNRSMLYCILQLCTSCKHSRIALAVLKSELRHAGLVFVHFLHAFS